MSGRAGVIVSAASVPLAVLALLGATALTAALHPGLGSVGVIEIGVPLLIGLVGTLFVHEGVHAGAFLLLGGRPRFGWTTKSGLPFLYSSCPGARFRPLPFIAIGLAPLILLDVAAVALLVDVHTIGLGIGVLTINTAGSVGDLWLSGLVLSRGSAIRWEAAAGRFLLWGPPPR